MVVRKVQLEFCFESKLFAPSDDILTVQRYELFLEPPNFSPTFFTLSFDERTRRKRTRRRKNEIILSKESRKTYSKERFLSMDFRILGIVHG